MSSPVRRRRVMTTSADDWDDALEQCARNMGDGEWAIIHFRGCPANQTTAARCDCRAKMIGPAVRDFLQ